MKWSDTQYDDPRLCRCYRDDCKTCVREARLDRTLAWITYCTVVIALAIFAAQVIRVLAP